MGFTPTPPTPPPEPPPESPPTPMPTPTDEGVAPGPQDASTFALRDALDEPILTDIYSGAALLLSTAVPDGLSDPYSSAQGGWIVGSQDVDPYTGVAAASGTLDPFTGQNVDPYTNMAADGENANAFTGGQKVDPYTGVQNADSYTAGSGATTQPHMLLASAVTPNVNEGPSNSPGAANAGGPEVSGLFYSNGNWYQFYLNDDGQWVITPFVGPPSLQQWTPPPPQQSPPPSPAPQQQTTPPPQGSPPPLPAAPDSPQLQSTPTPQQSLPPLPAPPVSPLQVADVPPPQLLDTTPTPGAQPTTFSPPGPPPPEPATAPAVPDWTTQTEWVIPADPRLMQSVTSVDTGNRPLNFLLNKGLLPWWNVLVSALNVPLMSLYGLEDLSSRINDALMHSSVQMEYQASKDLLPLERAWGLTMEIGPALDYAATWLSTSPRFQALARAPAFWVMGAGGIGGGIPVLSQSAPTALNETSALGAQLPNSLQSLEETVESSVSGWRTQEVEDLLQRAEEAGLRVSANGPESWTPRQIEAAIEYREVYNRTLSGPFHK